MNYLVNCGRQGHAQVIHVDRMRLCKNQLLRGETALVEENDAREDGSQAGFGELCTPDTGDLSTDDLDNNQCFTDRPRRVRQQHAWLRDFIKYYPGYSLCVNR